MSHLTILPSGAPGAPDDITPDEPALSIRSVAQNTAATASCPHLALANFYVAVKSCPLIILAGPSGSGKLTLARLTTRLLGGNQRTSSMIGHARWVAGSSHSGMLVEAQTRLNKTALFALIEEAWQPEQQGRPFVACLQRISPAELDPFFTREGLDLLYRQFLGWRQSSALPLLPLPPNLTLIATIDTDRFCWWDMALLDAVTVVPWPAPVPDSVRPRHQVQLPLLCSGNFLQGSIRDATAAHARLLQLLPRSSAPFRRLLQVTDALEEVDVCMPRAIMNRITVFAANAWSEADARLFSRDPLANLDCALQLGIIQYVLPWLAVSGHEEAMLPRVFPLLDEVYGPLVTLLVG